LPEDDRKVAKHVGSYKFNNNIHVSTDMVVLFIVYLYKT